MAKSNPVSARICRSSVIVVTSSIPKNTIWEQVYSLYEYLGGYRDGAQARFNNPTGLTIGPDIALYVADSGNQCIRVVREVK